MRYPVDQKFVITSRFGATANRPVSHRGTDYVSDNKIIRAVENGKAVSGYNTTAGNFINLTIGNRRWLYGHMRDRTNFNGNVTEGQQLGIMGATGNANGVHLCLILYIGGQLTDSNKFIEANSGNIGGDMATDNQIDEAVSLLCQLIYGKPASDEVFKDWRKLIKNNPNNSLEGLLGILKGSDTNPAALKNQPRGEFEELSFKTFKKKV